MSSFTQPLWPEPVASGEWRSTRDVVYEVGKRGSGLKITIPAGTVSDFMTLNWFGRVLVNPTDSRWATAGFLHDGLYGTPEFSRLMADCILFEALIVLGMRPVMAWVVYCVVRLGGASHYEQAQKEAASVKSV